VIRAAAEPQRTIIGTFMVLAAVVAAVAPMPVSLRSAAVALFAYLAFAAGGMAFAYVAALLAPALGLLGGDAPWLVMLPIVLSGNLLAMLGLEFAWRWAALIVSPVLLVAPALFVQTMSRRELFRVELPWDDARGVWVGLHLLVGVFGVLVALLIDRQRAARDTGAAATPTGKPGGGRASAAAAPSAARARAGAGRRARSG
jgi:hypothetical protein